jgi:hypothetical protein
MCDFEDMDLNQVRPMGEKSEEQKLIEPIDYMRNSMEELDEREGGVYGVSER